MIFTEIGWGRGTILCYVLFLSGFSLLHYIEDTYPHLNLMLSCPSCLLRQLPFLDPDPWGVCCLIDHGLRTSD